jgi:hypothetical protein
MLKGEDVFMSSLQEPPAEPYRYKTLPPILHMQLDNCAKANKYHYGIYSWSLLVTNDIFKCVCVCVCVCVCLINFFNFYGGLHA